MPSGGRATCLSRYVQTSSSQLSRNIGNKVTPATIKRKGFRFVSAHLVYFTAFFTTLFHRVWTRASLWKLFLAPCKSDDFLQISRFPESLPSQPPATAAPHVFATRHPKTRCVAASAAAALAAEAAASAVAPHFEPQIQTRAPCPRKRLGALSEEPELLRAPLLLEMPKEGERCPQNEWNV